MIPELNYHPYMINISARIFENEVS